MPSRSPSYVPRTPRTAQSPSPSNHSLNGRPREEEPSSASQSLDAVLAELQGRILPTLHAATEQVARLQKENSTLRHLLNLDHLPEAAHAGALQKGDLVEYFSVTNGRKWLCGVVEGFDEVSRMYKLDIQHRVDAANFLQDTTARPRGAVGSGGLRLPAPQPSTHDVPDPPAPDASVVTSPACSTPRVPVLLGHSSGHYESGGRYESAGRYESGRGPFIFGSHASEGSTGLASEQETPARRHSRGSAGSGAIRPVRMSPSSHAIAEYQLWPAWARYGAEVHAQESLGARGTQGRRVSSWSHNQSRFDKLREVFLVEAEEELASDWWVISPMSYPSIFWDALSIVLILYDFVVVPFTLAFQPDSVAATDAMTWVTRFFWTLSLPLQLFCVGYMGTMGNIERRWTMLAKHYLMTWFSFDLLIVLSDWMEVVFNGMSGSNPMDLARGARFVRAMRVLRLLRITKMPMLLDTLSTRSSFEQVRAFMSLSKICGATIGLLHLITCVWYVVGRDHGHGWVSHYGFKDAKLFSSYMVAAHWAASLFVGTVDIYPIRDVERLFAVVAFVFCFFVSCWIVSEATASLTRISIVSGQASRQFAILRQFLEGSKISSELMVRVVRCAHHQVAQQEKNVPENEVALLSLISAPLLAEIRYEANRPTLTNNPFFACYQLYCPTAVRKLCSTALSHVSLSLGDLLFAEGECSATPQTYFVVMGSLLYMKSSSEDVVRLWKDEWACEMALWVRWLHLGDLRATEHCHIMNLNVKTFHEVAAEHQEPEFYPAKYAIEVVKMLSGSTMDLTKSTEPIDDISYGALNIHRLLMTVFPRRAFSKASSSSLADYFGPRSTTKSRIRSPMATTNSFISRFGSFGKRPSV